MRAAAVVWLAAALMAGSSGCDFQMGSRSTDRSDPALASGGESSSAPAGDSETADGAEPSAQRLASTAPSATRQGQIPQRPIATSASDASGSQPAAASSGDAPASEGSAPAAAGGSEAARSCYDESDRLTCPQSELDEDMERLAQAIAQVREIKSAGYDLTSTSPSYEEALQKLPTQQAALAAIEWMGPFVERFEQRYLSDFRPRHHQVRAAAEARFSDAHYRIYYDMDEVQQFVTRVPEQRARNVETCLTILENALARDPSTLHPIYRVRHFSNAVAAIDVCPQYAPGDASVRARAEAARERLEGILAANREQELEMIRERRWEGSIGSVSAGNPAALANAGRAFLRGHREWGGNDRDTNVLVVSVRGDWFVASRDILGRPATWGLPVHVAITNEATPDEIVQVFDLSLVTAGRNKGGSFGAYRVGNTWRMLRSNLPSGAR